VYMYVYGYVHSCDIIRTMYTFSVAGACKLTHRVPLKAPATKEGHRTGNKNNGARQRDRQKRLVPLIMLPTARQTKTVHLIFLSV
jgi:hypothetical protein